MSQQGKEMIKKFLKPTLLKVVIFLLLITIPAITSYLYKENLEPAQRVLLAKGEQVTVNPIANFLYLVFVTIPVRIAKLIPNTLVMVLGDSASSVHFLLFCLMFVLQSYLLACICSYVMRRLKLKKQI